MKFTLFTIATIIGAAMAAPAGQIGAVLAPGATCKEGLDVWCQSGDCQRFPGAEFGTCK